MKEILILIALLVMLAIPPMIALMGRMNDESREHHDQ
jgi:hypothetical protein